MGVLSAVPPDSRSTGLTYEAFYGLKEQPFSLSTAPRYFYRSPSHAVAFEDLRTAIERRARVMVVSGDVGTGKTTLCRAIAAEFDRRAITALIPDPTISRDAFLRSLLADFEAVPADNLAERLHGVSETELRLLLRARLHAFPSDAIPLVVIDEAQKLSAAIADEVNLLTDEDDPLQVLLVGQLDLAERLAVHDMRRLDQRASARCTLAPLDRAGVAGYISYRLQKAGGSPDRISFSDAAIETVCQRSGGVPRLVNRICDRALASAHAQRAAVVDPAMIGETASSACPVTPVPARAPDSLTSRVKNPPQDDVDLLETWLTAIEQGAAPTKAVVPVQDAPALPQAAPPPPTLYVPQPRRTGGGTVAVRIRFRRRAHDRRRKRLERRTDRWARWLGTILLTLTMLLVGATVAPSVIDISSGLWAHVRTALAPAASHPRH